MCMNRNYFVCVGLVEVDKGVVVAIAHIVRHFVNLLVAIVRHGLGILVDWLLGFVVVFVVVAHKLNYVKISLM